MTVSVSVLAGDQTFSEGKTERNGRGVLLTCKKWDR